MPLTGDRPRIITQMEYSEVTSRQESALLAHRYWLIIHNTHRNQK